MTEVELLPFRALGVTKRELFTIAAMHTLCAGDYAKWEHLAQDAVSLADAILAALSQQPAVPDCRCIDCGGDQPEHDSTCKWMAELHGEKPAAGDEIEYEYEVWQHDNWQAGGREADYASAQSEANHYAMMYAQDGPVEVRIYEKRLLSTAQQPAAPSEESEEAGIEPLLESLIRAAYDDGDNEREEFSERVKAARASVVAYVQSLNARDRRPAEGRERTADIELMYDAVQAIKRQDAWGNAQLTEALMEAEERAERAEAENKRLREALKDIRSRSAMNWSMRLDPFARIDELGNIHQIADAALAKENSND